MANSEHVSFPINLHSRLGGSVQGERAYLVQLLHVLDDCFLHLSPPELSGEGGVALGVETLLPCEGSLQLADSVPAGADRQKETSACGQYQRAKMEGGRGDYREVSGRRSAAKDYRTVTHGVISFNLGSTASSPPSSSSNGTGLLIAL